MKANKKEQAQFFRKIGMSVNDISRKLGVAQSSVSSWVKSVKLTAKQKSALKARCHSPEVVERRRHTRLQNESVKRKAAIDSAALDIKYINNETLKILGTSLYWAEGAKTNLGMARLTNSDPKLIQMAMRYFREICIVPESKFRAHIHIHSVDAANDAEKYWSKVTRISRAQFYKTYCIKSKSSKNKRFTLPYGTLEIGICDVKLHLQILGWIEGIKNQVK